MTSHTCDRIQIYFPSSDKTAPNAFKKLRHLMVILAPLLKGMGGAGPHDVILHPHRTLDGNGKVSAPGTTIVLDIVHGSGVDVQELYERLSTFCRDTIGPVRMTMQQVRVAV